MKREYHQYADPFYGSQEAELPEPSGIAKKWFFLKAQTGNCHPGAVLPFGMVSACPYTGGYPNGYTPLWLNSDARPPRLQPENDKYAMGISHFHQSGTGYIGEFYNFFIVTPSEKRPSGRFDRFSLKNESAVPGSYSCTLGGIPLSLTVNRNAAAERFDFGTDGYIAFDLGLNGLVRENEMHDPPGLPEETERVDGGFLCTVQYKRKLHICVLSDSLQEIGRPEEDRLIAPVKAGRIELFIGFSFASRGNAVRNARTAYAQGFDSLLAGAGQEWEGRLSAIDIDGSDEQKRKFYSNLYQSLIKPSMTFDDGPYEKNGIRLSTCEYATMWDVGKSELPLLMMLYPDVGEKIAETLMDCPDVLGFMPNSFLLTPPDGKCDEQAMALPCLSIYDAFIRGVKGVTAEKALAAVEKELSREKYRPFFEEGRPCDNYPSHTIDLASASYCACQLALACGETEKAEAYRKASERWKLAYDNDGLCRAGGSYYEGTRWNYSFRLLPYMKERIALSEDFAAQLDYFFGYGRKDAVQMKNPKTDRYLTEVHADGFEGFNNETDMETPYAYLYVGKYERTEEILRAAEASVYALGRGGLCGNNDSGGLSSLYVFNALGLLPVAGQNLVLLSRPSVERAVIRLANGKALTVSVRKGRSDSGCGEGVSFNGQPLPEHRIAADELQKGGELVFGV